MSIRHDYSKSTKPANAGNTNPNAVKYANDPEWFIDTVGKFVFGVGCNHISDVDLSISTTLAESLAYQIVCDLADGGTLEDLYGIVKVFGDKTPLFEYIIQGHKVFSVEQNQQLARILNDLDKRMDTVTFANVPDKARIEFAKGYLFSSRQYHKGQHDFK